jgi:hypothetical protein
MPALPQAGRPNNSSYIIIIIIIIKVLFSRQTSRNVDEIAGYRYLKLLSERPEIE